MRNLFTKLFSSKSRSSRQGANPRPPCDEIRSRYGVPPTIADFFGDIKETDEPGWNYELWLEEWAESYLGTEQFNSLKSRFASTPGVTAIAHPDRETFLIESGLEAKRLRQLLWQHFVEAAQIKDSINQIKSLVTKTCVAAPALDADSKIKAE
jgi:hypothetical protein